MRIPNQLEGFTHSFFQLLKESIDEWHQKLRDKFWLPRNRWLVDAIPWKLSKINRKL